MAKELISAYEFAKRKNVSATIVYRRINAGHIETTLIGKTSYIDWNSYSDIEFPKGGKVRISASN